MTRRSIYQSHGSYGIQWRHHSWESKVPPHSYPPPINKALLRDYQPLVSLNKALLGPYFLGGVALGGVP